MTKAKKTNGKKNNNGLDQLRGELETQAKRIRAEVKKEMRAAERNLAALKKQVRPLQRAAKKSASDVVLASENLVQTVKRGYDRMLRSMSAQ